MATSGSYDFTLDRDGMVSEAYRLLGGIAIGEDPTTEELTDGGRTLNLMLKGWQAEGIGLWLERTVTLFLGYEKQSYLLGSTGDNCSTSVVKTEMKVAGVATDSTIDVDSITGITDGDYIGIELDDNTVQWTTINGSPSGDTITLTDILTGASAIDNHVYTYTSKIQRPLKVIEARHIAADGNSIDLLPISRQEYMNLPDKTTTGTVNQFFYDAQLDNGVLYLWPTCSNVQETVQMTLKYPIMDFDASTDNGEFPVEWMDAVVLNLAIRIGIKIGVTPDQNLMALAAEAKFHVKSFDVEKTSMFLQPATR